MNPGKKIVRVGVREGYDLWSSTYDTTPNAVVAMDERWAVPLLAPQPGERVLDAGRGTGRHLIRLAAAGARPLGLDFSPGMLSVARARAPAVPLVQADLQQPLPFRQPFDAVLCSLIGEHLPHLAGTIREFSRVLRPGGRLVFTVYHPELAASGIEANFDVGATEYRLGAVLHTAEDYRGMVQSAGFRQIVTRDVTGDDELARTVPKAKGLLNRKVILAITAVCQT